MPALERASASGVPVFVHRVHDYPDREAWDAALTAAVASHRPDIVVLAGFMKLTGKAFLRRFAGRTVNTHPALLPSFPGMHGPRDALEHGVKVSGCTVFLVDEDVDGGPIIAQAAVPVLENDTEQSLHERIKSVERTMVVETVGRMVREGWTVEGRRVTIP
ncbi:MAG: phosphoribosylglycinamide formyltransferase [Streptosporangiales bacterium]|nr:phosphoribosylglycinamide formyltransferase [Streptosporangiales bacterium]